MHSFQDDKSVDSPNHAYRTTEYLGKPTSRVDGPAKVTGAAKYAAEFNVPNLSYGVIVSSAHARGKITKIDSAAAEAVPGVIKVLSHENVPRTAYMDRSYREQLAPYNGSPFPPALQTRAGIQPPAGGARGGGNV